ncbi:MAG: 5'-3' exonuclease [Propionibacterium sp.]|jgi:5'-3' exonuclease|uniref:5'-3' exonuclease n=1 Tax=Brooklawnia propionicigenes TaxID=3041175 RepID=A0AAN0ME34_9ACTN|nr:5'-3' exonuclease [Brooklawnia sp. SH051]MEA5120795.1 5'-3' exonuclease [Propionibacterium sp.]NLI86526.1 5'-3' exonuclease [Propionibacterium sp.]BEH00763.1 5'-3' exonuclease [Brooklawnia sp. SH051]
MTDALSLIVDTATLYFRAYYGVPTTLRDQQGRPVNALHGMLDMLARLIDQYQPAAVVCCRDDDWRPSWRVDLVPSYKTHRVSTAEPADAEQIDDELARQVPWILDCLDAAGICQAGASGYEADDICGTLARRAAARGRRAVVVSGDRDLFQLVADRIQVAYIARGVAKHELVDDAWLQNRYGLRGDQYADLATLRGDPSDGLPGIAGIGEKTAAALLNSYGDLDAIIAAAADPSSRMSAKLRLSIGQADDYLQRARRVVATADVDLPELDDQLYPGRADQERCRRLAEDHNSRGPMNRLLAALGSQPVGG